MKLISYAIEYGPMSFLWTTMTIVAFLELGPVKFLFFVLFMVFLKIMNDKLSKIFGWCISAFLWILCLIFPHSSGIAENVEDEGEAGI